MAKKIVIFTSVIFIIIVSAIIFIKSQKETDLIDTKGLSELYVDQQKGNVWIEEWDEKEMKVYSKTVEISKKSKTISIQSNGKKELQIKIPKSIRSVTVNTKASGNIKVDISKPEKIHLNSAFGNILANIGKINKTTDVNIHTDFGNVYVSVPNGSKVATINGPTAPILIDVNKSNEGPMMKLTQTTGIPKIVGTNSDKVQPAAGTVVPDELTPAQMKEDFTYLLEQFKSQNPLYQKSPGLHPVPSITKPLKKEDFYFVMNEWLAPFHDGHTIVYPMVSDYIDMPSYWAETGLYVTKNTKQLTAGDKILSIGGKNVDSLLVGLEKITSAEHVGWVKAQAADKLSIGAYLRYFNLIGAGNSVPLQVESNGKIRTIGLPLKNFNPNKLSEPDYLYANLPTLFFESTILKDKDIAIFTLNECWYTKILSDGLAKFFEEVKQSKIHNVAIDLRKNGGGSALVINFLQENIERSGLSKDHVFIFTTGNTFSAAVDTVVHFKYSNQATIVGMPPGNVPFYGGNVRPIQLPNSKIALQFPTTYSGPDIPEQDLHHAIIPDIRVDYTGEAFRDGIDPWIEAVLGKIKQ